MSHIERNSSWFNQETAGAGIQSGGVEVVPFSKSAGMVGDHGGWIWNRPSKIEIRSGEEVNYIPVLNLTRLIQIFLFTLSFLFSLIGLLSILRTKKRSQNDG
jgi:hypothetical protein